MPEEKLELLRQTTELLEQSMREREEQKRLMHEDRKLFLETLSKDITAILAPVLQEMSDNTKSLLEKEQITKEEILDAIRNAEAPHVDVHVPPIKVPEANVNVNIPPISLVLAFIFEMPLPMPLPPFNPLPSSLIASVSFSLLTFRFTLTDFAPECFTIFAMASL